MFRPGADLEDKVRIYNGQALNEIANHLKDDWDHANNRLVVERGRLREIIERLEPWLRKVEGSPTATNKGYPLAAAYDAHTKGWTTQSHIVELDDASRYFVLFSYPQGKVRRINDRITEIWTSDHLCKPWPWQWQDRVQARSVIPTVKLENDVAITHKKDVVIMPFIPCINALDLWAHRDRIGEWGPFKALQGLTWQDSMRLLGHASLALRALHVSGKTWGEATLPNVVFTERRLPFWVDAEMKYKCLSPLQERATDVRNLIISSTGALSGIFPGDYDLHAIIDTALWEHPDAVLAELDTICATELSWGQRHKFESFGKYRLGAKNLVHFEQTKRAIRERLEGI